MKLFEHTFDEYYFVSTKYAERRLVLIYAGVVQVYIPIFYSHGIPIIIQISRFRYLIGFLYNVIMLPVRFHNIVCLTMFLNTGEVDHK